MGDEMYSAILEEVVKTWRPSVEQLAELSVEDLQRLFRLAKARKAMGPRASKGDSGDAGTPGETEGVVRFPLRCTRERARESEPSVAKRYKPLRKHPALFDVEAGWPAEWFDPEFVTALQDETGTAWSKILCEHVPGQVFSCKMFSEMFCDMLIEEVDHFRTTGLPARRPNSMNNYGIILNEIGWRPMVNILQDCVLAHISKKWWHHILPFDSHHTFIVRYKEGEDKGLDMHTDDSDVTFNLCLGREFTGATLTFCGGMGKPDHRKHSYTFDHEKGRCVWHLGRLRHGADDLASGERLNLIIWNHSSAYRETAEYILPGYQKEDGPPDKVCLSFTHDRDYGVFKEYTEKIKGFEGRGWCPRKNFEYDGFEVECPPKSPESHE